MRPENDRIQSVYAQRDSIGRRSLYEWYRPEVRQWELEKERVASALLSKFIGTNLGKISVLDIGCGTGEFLRKLIEWGATPGNLVGTEFLMDRLETAREKSVQGVDWRLGGLDFAEPESFDLVVTNTVFSSILDVSERKALSQEMWRVLKPGGWVMVFDFRYNNPSNSNVSKVTRAELQGYWDEVSQEYYRTLCLAPPLARRIVPLSRLAGEILTLIAPFLKSHFYFLKQKPK